MEKIKKYLTIFSLGLAGGAIYILPYIKYVFYDQQMQVMGITNAQSGMILSVYAITAVILFPLGGILADKIPVKKLMLFSLIATTILTFLYAFTLDFKLSLIIWVCLAFTTGTTWWPSLIKAVGKTGPPEEAGRTYGIYYACNGICAALINAIALWGSTLSNNAEKGFFIAIALVGGGTVLAAIMIFLFYNEDNSTSKNAESNDEKFKLADVGKVIKNPHTWLLGVVIFASFTIYASASYFTPYLIDVVGISPEGSGIYAIIRTYIFMLLAPVGGYMCDKVLKTTANWFMMAFATVALLYVGVLMIPSSASVTFASVYTLIPGAIVMAEYGVAWSILRELDIPAIVIGTAIGLSSILGWLPDIFMHTMFGRWLDVYGNQGYTYIFMYLTVIALLGFACGFIVQRNNRRKKLASIEKSAGL